MTSYLGPQLNQLQHNAAEAAASVSGDPVADELDGQLRPPEGARCALCGEPLQPQQDTRRGPSGLRHESCD